MNELSRIGKQCQKRFLVINFLSIEKKKTSKMTKQNDIFFLSPVDNLDDGCWSTFTFFFVPDISDTILSQSPGKRLFF